MTSVTSAGEGSKNSCGRQFNILFMFGFFFMLLPETESCNTVQTCIEYVHKGNIILIQIIIAELYPF